MLISLQRYCMLVSLFMPVVVFSQGTEDDGAMRLSVSAGYQQQQFNWSVAGNLQGSHPNIYSELRWEKLKGVLTRFDCKWEIANRLFFHSDIAAGFTLSGRATDTDYQEDNRTSPSFHARLTSNRGSTIEMKAGIGYKFLHGSTYNATASAGYGINRQSLVLTDNNTSAGLHSTYTPVWKGPFISIEQSLSLSHHIRANALFTYHHTRYTAKANWNLIDEFQHPVSFRHFAKGYGLSGGIQLTWRPAGFFSLIAGAEYFHYATGYGIDELYKADGQIVKTRFNGVFNSGFTFRIGAGLAF